ncbi:MAG: hypothetical protein AAF225_10360 [Pseudomonadota bacterium]
MFRALGIALSVSAAMIVSAQAAVFVENFDDQTIGPDWSVYDTFGQFVTTAGGGIEIQRGIVTDSHSGHQHVELDSHVWGGGGSTNSAMAATVDLVAGITYELTFAYKPRTDSLDDNGINFSIGSLTGRNYTVQQWLGDVNNSSSRQRNWDVVSKVFTALDGDNAIQFSAFGLDNSYGGLIDSIKIAEVTTPLPAAGVLLVFGLLMLRIPSQKKQLRFG